MLVAAVVLLGLSSACTILAASEEELACSFEDDAFYCFVIARNIADTGTSTFDGTTLTNGYHPMWMVAILPVFLSTHDPLVHLRIVGILSILLVFSGVLAGILHISRRHTLLTSTICAFLLLRYARDFARMSMETSILIPLCIAAVILADRAASGESPGLGDLVVLGMVFMLVIMSRIDAALLVLLFMTVVIPRLVRAGNRKGAIAVVIPSLIVPAAYLTYNWCVFGHFMSVSGSIKASPFSFNELFARQLFLLSDPL